ncbi:ribosome biogenesis GTPase Der, partial [bacterium]|nr:ribosome biogenesis GTPase Der [bacterium]
IIGRPNVGKSTLFNRIIGKRQAIVGAMPGVTRDRHYAQTDWLGKEFILVDTGGIDIFPDEELARLISEQSIKALSEAEVIVCLFDGRGGPLAADREIVNQLRKQSKPVVYAINKIDQAMHEKEVNEFFTLGVGEVIPVSAEHGRGVDDLLDKVISYFSKEEKTEREIKEHPTIAVIGRPNVGKSTLINQIAGVNRVVASELPGTTRDSIDVEIKRGEKQYLFIDTGGIRRKSTITQALDHFTIVKSLHSVERAQVVCLLLDTTEGLTKQDLNLAAFAYEQGKGVIVLINKWDLAKNTQEEYIEYIKKQLKELHNLPILCISALTGQGCNKILDSIDEVMCLLQYKISSSKLNSVIERVVKEHHIPIYKGKEVKFYYGTQVNTFPPTILIFSNYPEGLSTATRRYLVNRMREHMGIQNVPLRIVFKKRT